MDVKPSFIHCDSKRASTRCWYSGFGTWAGTGDWFDPAFDDSDWPLSLTPTISGSFPVPAGVEEVAPWLAPPTPTTTLFYRSHITPPLIPGWSPYFFEQYTPAPGLQEVWINGYGMLGGAGRSIVTHPGFVTFTEDTVVAGFYGDPSFQWFPVTEGWQAFRITFYSIDSGKPYAWGTITPGVNDKGVLGVGDTSTHLTPTAVDTSGGLPETIIKVASNGKTTLFLTADGHLWGCGDNSTGMVGFPYSPDSDPHPTPIHMLDYVGVWPVSDISIGDDCAMAMSRDGQVLLWGLNAFGSFGRGDTIPGTASYTAGSPATAIAAGKNFAAIANKSNLLTAGDNTYGQLGVGTTGTTETTWVEADNTNFPTANITQLSAGEDQLLALFNSEDVGGAGRGIYGSLYGAGFAATPPERIVSILTSLGSFGVIDVQQAGPLAFFDTGFFGAGVQVAGDGTPYGGAGDSSLLPFNNTYLQNPDIAAYGLFLQAGTVTIATSTFETIPLAPIDGLAYSSGGSQNDHGTGQQIGSLDSSGTVSFVANPTHTTIIPTTTLVPDLVYLLVQGTSTGSGSGRFVQFWMDFFDASNVQIGSSVGVVSIFAGQEVLGAIIPPTGAAKYSMWALLDAGPALYTATVSVVQATQDAPSKAVFAAFGFHPHATFFNPDGDGSDGLLYTWGWGGAGQMGSGHDSLVNAVPISVNGLQGVIAATVARACMFAIPKIALPPPPANLYYGSLAQIVG